MEVFLTYQSCRVDPAESQMAGISLFGIVKASLSCHLNINLELPKEGTSAQ